MLSNSDLAIVANANITSMDAEACRNYLNSRNINNHIINKYCLGWLGNDQSDVDLTLLGRLIVPLHDLYGDVIAFAGRIPTYSDGSKIYSLYNNELISVKGEYCLKPTWRHQSFFKRNYLYGLKQAYQHIIDCNYVLIVEGEFDLWACVQSGLLNTVALLGSTMSILQFAKLRRFCDNVFLLLDGDEAGQIGASKIIEAYKDYGDIQNIKLPDNSDPFDFISKYGIDPIHKCIENIIAERSNLVPF